VAGAPADSEGGRRHRLDPDSRTWLDGLSRGADQRERKLAELHDLMQRAARHEVARRRHWASAPGLRDREDLVEEIAGDALLLVVDKLDTFRGESRFTTWVYALVMNVTSAKLARQAARPLPLTMEDHDWDRLPDRLSVDPQHSAEVREILAAVRSAVEQKLTERQRRVFVAVALNEVAIDELAEQLGANRNAIYKTLFDARRKLRVHLDAAGYRIPATAPDAA
jgi:RNA polymerase sigma-70 factor (ECF subfamily)